MDFATRAKMEAKRETAMLAAREIIKYFKHMAQLLGTLAQAAGKADKAHPIDPSLLTQFGMSYTQVARQVSQKRPLDAGAIVDVATAKDFIDSEIKYINESYSIISASLTTMKIEHVLDRLIYDEIKSSVYWQP